MTARESFPGLLLAEWTKLRSVSRWATTLLGAVALTIGLGYLTASSNRTDVNEYGDFVAGPLGEPVSDVFYFVHQPITGDTTITVRVASLTAAQPEAIRRVGGEQMTLHKPDSPFAGATAGVMIKDGTEPGSSYTAVVLTAAHGVRMQWDFDTDRKGSASSGTRWLRLVRAGNTITGYESADGSAWQRIATATPKRLQSTMEVGFYVSSSAAVYVSRVAGSTSTGETPTYSDAVFDSVQLGSATAWKANQVGNPAPFAKGDAPQPGRLTESGGTYTVTGVGQVGPRPLDDDIVEMALFGVIAGLMALIAVGVLFATSEYRRGMIRTTFAATPRRGRVLAAKAIVLGVTSFGIGLAGAIGSFLVAIPIMQSHGYTPPGHPSPSLMDGPVIRVMLLTAAFMAVVAVFGLGVGVLLRHSAGAITLTIVLVLLPVIVGSMLPSTAARWLMLTTLAGGLATQRAKPPTIALVEPWAMISPWAGITVVSAYAAIALLLAWWQLRRRDA